MSSTETATLIAALRILAHEIKSDDGVANACIAEAADRIGELCAENTTLRDYVGDGLLRSDYKSAQEMRVEIKRLREEVMHLRMYAPGQRQAHAIRMASHVGPTNFAAWGITPDTGTTEDPS